MSMDPIADMLAVINNANHKYLEKGQVPSSKFKKAVLEILKKEGYITGYKEVDSSGRKVIKIYMKYSMNTLARHSYTGNTFITAKSYQLFQSVPCL